MSNNPGLEVPPNTPAAATPTAIEDLRFTIGLFFLLVSLILLVAGVLPQAYVPAGANSTGVNLNLASGAGMLCFSLLMLGLWGADRARS